MWGADVLTKRDVSPPERSLTSTKKQLPKEVKMSTSTLTLTGKQWESFCKVLKGLARTCNDVDINEGIIRQRSNDGAAIFKADLRPFVGGATLTITNLKEKLKTLKMFKSGVTITLAEDEALLSDGISSYTIAAPDRNYLDNKFMSQAELESLIPLFSQETFSLIRNKIKKLTLKRIRTAVSKLKTNNCKVVFKKHSASLRVEKEMGGSKRPESSVRIITEIPLFDPTAGFTQLPSFSFTSFDYDGDMVWELYRADEILFCMVQGRIGEVMTTTYTSGQLKSSAAE
jgi:hypothetical protein